MAFPEVIAMRAGEDIYTGDYVILDAQGYAQRCAPGDAQYVALSSARMGYVLHVEISSAAPVASRPAVSAPQAATLYIIDAALQALHSELPHQTFTSSRCDEHRFMFRMSCRCGRGEQMLVSAESIPMLGIDCFKRFLKKDLMCCPRKSEYDKQQRRIRDCWFGYADPGEIAATVLHKPLNQRRLWAEEQLCLIDSGSDRTMAKLVLRPVVRGDLGPKFLFDVNEEVVVRGTSQLCQPSDKQKDEVRAAVRADIRRHLQEAQRPTAPWWDPYQ